MIPFVLAVMANAFGRRFAGGLLGHWLGNIGGTQVARLVQAAIVGATVAALAPVWWWSAVAVPLTFAGAVWGFPLWIARPPFIRFGTSNMVPKNASETASLSLNGMVATAPLTLGAMLVGLSLWPVIAIAGLARGPLYWLAAAYTPPWRWVELRVWADDQKRWLLQPTALTEFYAGGVLGLALWVVLCF